MIINTFLKTQGIQMSTSQKKVLGMNVARAYRDMHPGQSIPMVSIREGGESIQVCDYPRDWLLKHGPKYVKRYEKAKKARKLAASSPKVESHGIQQKNGPAKGIKAHERKPNGQ